MEKIRSTMLIEAKAFILVSNLCRNYKTTLKEIIERSMLNMIQSELSCNRLKTFSSVKYQKRGREYIQVHYSIDPQKYELLLDIRKLRKLSISRLFSDFIKEFLMNKNNAKHCFKFFFEKLDRNQINYKIRSIFSKENQTFTFIIKAKLE